MEMPGTGSWSPILRWPNHYVCPSEETAVPHRREDGNRKQHWATLKQWCSSGRNWRQNWKLAVFQKHGANKVINLIAKYFPHRTLSNKVYMQLVCRPSISLTRQTVRIAPGDGHTNPLCHPVRHWYHLCSNLTQEWLPITEICIIQKTKNKKPGGSQQNFWPVVFQSLIIIIKGKDFGIV